MFTKINAPFSLCFKQIINNGRSLLLLILIGLLSISISAQTGAANDTFLLETLMARKSVTRKIADGETHFYKIPLLAKQFLSVAVEQQGIDVVVTLLSPDGAKLVEVDSPIGASGIEKLLFIAAAAGDYRLQIASLEKAAKPAEYSVTLTELRESEALDAKRIDAARLVAEAFQVQEQRTAAGFTKAIEIYNQALPIYQATNDRADEGLVRRRLGQLYTFVNRHQPALEQNLQALAIARETKNQTAEAASLDDLGRNYYELEDFAKAIDFYDQALRLRTGSGSQAGTTVSLNGISSVYAKQGEYVKAIEYAERVLTLYRELGNVYGEASSLLNLGTIYAAFGEHTRAIEFFKLALPLFRTVKANQFEIVILTNSGRSYAALGEKQTAIDFYNQALPLTRAVGNHLLEAATLSNIGSLNEELGERITALDYFNRALSRARETGKRALTAMILNNIAEIRQEFDELQTALELENEALKLAREASDRASEATILNNLGRIFGLQGKNAEALAQFNQALEIQRALGNRAAQAVTLTNIGKIHYAQGESDRAFENYEQALALVRAVKNARIEAETLFCQAKLQNTTGKFAAARTNIEMALAIIEKTRGSVGSENLRASYLAKVADYYSLRIEILMNLHQAQPSQGFDALAFEAAEKNRARTMLDSLAESRLDVRRGVDVQLLEREKTLRQSLAAKSDFQARLLGGRYTLAQAAAAAAEINKLTADYQEIKTEIRQKSPDYAALTQPTTLAVSEIQTKLLDRETILLEYALGNERSFLWVVEQNSLTSYELPKRAEIEATARSVYKTLTARNQNRSGEIVNNRGRPENSENLFAAAASRLSQMILQPAAQQLKNKRLLIVADGALQYVPFASLKSPKFKVQNPKLALIDKKQETKNEPQFLIESNEIVMLPSASILGVLRTKKKNESPPNSLAVIADPVFAIDDSRLREFAKAKKSTLAVNQTVRTRDQSLANETASVIRAGRESGLNEFPRLRFSRDEADSIAAIASGQNLLTAVDFAANKQTVTSENFGKHRIIHFATHGLINSQNPELSGIVLSLVDETGNAQNGFLRLFEIYNLKLESDLIVLSACQTALGKDVKGEGLIGLTRGFMYAGAPRVVASLWSVDDRATAELMRRFYQKMLRENLRPAAALRAAQIEMSKTARFGAPYYWAAFTLQGEWR